MTEQSRHFPGKTFEEELLERQARKQSGLRVVTCHVGDHFETQKEVRRWFREMFREHLIWESGLFQNDKVSHNWLPRTKDQAMLLKLTFGGS